ncbi:MAG: 30S ribosomal protein S6 [Pseudomonadota bacterium]
MHKYVQKKFREYETVFILSPGINQAAADGITKKIQATLERYEGKLTKVSLWGVRKLAYKISKHDKGIFYQLNYVAPQGFVDDMEKKFKLDDMILRYLTVKTSEEEVDPQKIIVKSPDVEFESVEALIESGSTDESIEEISEEPVEETSEEPGEEPAAPQEEKEEKKEEEAGRKPEEAVEKPAAEQVAKPIETIIINDDSFADIEVAADVKPPAAAVEDKPEKSSEEKPDETAKAEEDEKK